MKLKQLLEQDPSQITPNTPTNNTTPATQPVAPPKNTMQKKVPATPNQQPQKTPEQTAQEQKVVQGLVSNLIKGAQGLKLDANSLKGLQTLLTNVLTQKKYPPVSTPAQKIPPKQ